MTFLLNNKNSNFEINGDFLLVNISLPEICNFGIDTDKASMQNGLVLANTSAY